MLDQLDFTPRNVAKFVVKAAIAGKTAQFTEKTITDYTALDEDNFIVDITGGVVGWWLSDMLKPYTDKAVDKTADFLAAKRAAYKAKKIQKEVAQKED